MKSMKNVKKFLLYCLLLVVTVITLFPLLWAIAGSLRTDMELFKYTAPFTIHTIIPVEPTFDSYRTIFTEFNFLQPLVNTFVLVIILIPLGCLVNSIAAFGFAIFNFKGKNLLYGLVLVSFMIPFESIAMPLYNVIDDMGLIDTHMGMILPAIASGLVLFLFTQFFKDIPISLIEAGKIDGANLSQIFFKIIMPSSVPVFITAGLMIFMDQWNAYLWPLLVGRSEDIRTIQIAIGLFRMEKTTLWSCLYAGTIVSAIIPLAMFVPFQKYFVQGITSSGIKG